MDTMLNIELISRQIWGKPSYIRELMDDVCTHIGIIQGYLQAVTPSQLIKDPDTLDYLINRLGDLTGTLSSKATELDRGVPEIKTLITEARALADSEEAGNVEE